MDADIINAMHVALATGQSFKDTGLPDTAEMREWWDKCVKDRQAIKDRGGEVQMINDLTDRSPRVTDEYLGSLTVGKSGAKH